MLPNTIQYALRALKRLAEVDQGKAVSGRELAQQTGIPANYLSKIMLALGNVGIIEGSRGLGGGYRLLRPASEIRIVDVFGTFDTSWSNPSCLLGQDECSDEAPCEAHEAWKEVRRKFIEFLEHTNVADIAKRDWPEPVEKE